MLFNPTDWSSKHLSPEIQIEVSNISAQIVVLMDEVVIVAGSVTLMVTFGIHRQSSVQKALETQGLMTALVKWLEHLVIAARLSGVMLRLLVS